MTRRLLASFVLAVTGFAFLVAAPSAEAVSGPTAGWWSRLATTNPAAELPAALPVPAPTTPGTVPAGATVPEGQLLVEGSPDGPVAVTAIRWELDEGESGPSLTLNVAEGSSVNPQSVVLACRTATPWDPPETLPGEWETRPLADGRTCVNGVLADDLSTISFGIQPLVSGDVLDVVLTPGSVPVDIPPGVPEPPADIDGSSFRLVVEAPTPESLQVVAGSGFDQGSGDQFVTPDTTTPSFDDSTGDSFSAPGSDVGSDFTADTGTEEVPAFEVPDEVAAPGTGASDDIAGTTPVVSDGSAANRTIGFVLLLLAALMAGWTYLTSNTGQPTTIGLGRFKTTLPASAAAPALASAPAEPAVGGLSRFARTRTRPPTPLS